MSEIGLVERGRLRALVAAGIALSSELSLDDLLRRLVESAAALTGARYAALGVIDTDGRELERIITHGIDAEQFRRVGKLRAEKAFSGS
jgi:two-component system, NarL family, sensor histidine kinase DevS